MLNVWSVPKASLLPAFLLGILVLFTYSTLQNYGPESTVRKFHAAINNITQSQINNKGIPAGDWNTLRSTLIEDIGSLDGESGPRNYDATKAISQVIDQFRQGKTYSLARMDRHTRDVRIAVLYQRGKLPPTSMVWVVEKPYGGREWKISAQKTLSAMTGP
jgi:hypothetical protein